MRWKGPVLALLGAAAVAGIAIVLTLRGGSDKTVTGVAGTTSGGDGPSTGATTTTGEGVSIPKPGDVRPGHRLLVATGDDAMKQANPKTAAALMKVSNDAGFDAVLVSSMWTPGATAPSAQDRHSLRNVVKAADDLHMRVFVFVWHGLSGRTPHTEQARRQFAAYAAALAKAFPQVRDIVIGNEPNLNTFWMPQFGAGGKDVAAAGYLELLARTYDALKAVSPQIQVIGGALAPRGSDRPGTKRDTHSPTRFIEDLGAAYKASGRTKPVMDAFAIHPYMRMSKLSPTETHAESTTITLADYPELVALLDHAFGGTAQRGGDIPIYYTEFGVQTHVPAADRHAYTDVSSPSAGDAVSPDTQAHYYREALALSACQPTVKGLFIFHTFDEIDLAGWQSGLYYADQKPKSSLPAFQKAAADARAARLTRCNGTSFIQEK
jgi:Cellulase (glycosyl hydrolase family 5)